MLIFEQDRIGNGLQVTLVPNEDMVIRRDVLVMSRDSNGVLVTGTGHDINIAGALVAFGPAFGTVIGDPPYSTNKMVIGAKGLVQSLNSDAITGSWGNFTLTNEGTILASRAAMSFGATNIDISNSGRILGEDAIRLFVAMGGSARIVNDGEIRATDDFGTGISAQAGGDGSFTIINRGVIAGVTVARLGVGNDLFDNHQGRVNGGEVLLGAGNDRFLPGSGIEKVQAESGNDTVDFRKGGSVKVALDGTLANTGSAKGDSYIGFEFVQGSARDDTIRGDALNNILRGNGGDDRLDGAAGADILIGGSRRDTLTGGAGYDVFIFMDPGDGADVITDFTRLDGVEIDSLRVDASAFGIPGEDLRGEILPGRMLRSGAGNQAQDRNDRFIFRTGDETLWFDRDGKGGAGPVLIADFSDGVRLTANDIVLI